MEEGLRQPDTSTLCTKYFISPCTRCGKDPMYSEDVSKTHTFNMNAIDKVTKFHSFPLCYACASMEYIHGPDKDTK